MKDKFVGTWKLASWNHIVDGIETPYLGLGATGLLIYTGDGHMSAQVMGAGRQATGMAPEQVRRVVMNLHRSWTSRGVLKALRAIVNYWKGSLSYVAYAGRYEIDGDEVVHHVDLGLIPDWCGADQRRRFRFEANDRLVLMVDPIEGGTEHILVWERG